MQFFCGLASFALLRGPFLRRSEMFQQLRLGSLPASFARVNSIPLEAQPFALAAALFGVGAILLAIRLSITSRAHSLLRQSRNDLEIHLLRAQRDLASARDDAAEWRSQLQQQFDTFRAATAGQLTMGEARFERLQKLFDDASKSADKTQLELRTQLDVLRGMCAELPFAKARLLELERGSATGLSLPQFIEPAADEPQAEALAAPSVELQPAAEAAPLLPLPALADEPKLNGTNGHAVTLAAISPLPEPDETRLADLESQLAHAAQRNTALQRELITMKVRTAKVALAKAKRPRS